MLDIGWTELLAIAMVTILVVGPKDLPRVLRTVGKLTAKARAITREFQDSLDDMARQSDFDEIKREIDSTTYNSIGKLGDLVDPTGTEEKIFDLQETQDSQVGVAGRDAIGTGVAADANEPLEHDSAASAAGVDTAADQSAGNERQRQVGS
mgnify:CR=1 FL=1